MNLSLTSFLYIVNTGITYSYHCTELLIKFILSTESTFDNILVDYSHQVIIGVYWVGLWFNPILSG